MKKYKHKTIRTSRKCDKNNFSKFNADTEKNNSENNYTDYNFPKHSLKNKNEPKFDFLKIKIAFCIICLIGVFIVANIDTEFGKSAKGNIKTVISENISYKDIQKITNKVEDVFNKNNKFTQYEKNEFSDFRIDENIVNQMNNYDSSENGEK